MGWLLKPVSTHLGKKYWSRPPPGPIPLHHLLSRYWLSFTCVYDMLHVMWIRGRSGRCLQHVVIVRVLPCYCGCIPCTKHYGLLCVTYVCSGCWTCRRSQRSGNHNPWVMTTIGRSTPPPPHTHTLTPRLLPRSLKDLILGRRCTQH